MSIHFSTITSTIISVTAIIILAHRHAARLHPFIHQAHHRYLPSRPTKPINAIQCLMNPPASLQANRQHQRNLINRALKATPVIDASTDSRTAQNYSSHRSSSSSVHCVSNVATRTVAVTCLSYENALMKQKLFPTWKCLLKYFYLLFFKANANFIGQWDSKNKLREALMRFNDTNGCSLISIECHFQI